MPEVDRAEQAVMLPDSNVITSGRQVVQPVGRHALAAKIYRAAVACRFLVPDWCRCSS